MRSNGESRHSSIFDPGDLFFVTHGDSFGRLGSLLLSFLFTSRSVKLPFNVDVWFGS